MKVKCSKIKNNRINKPIFLIGMPRSGTTVISEAISAHEDLGWFSNYFAKLPFFPRISILNRLIHIPKIGWYLRGKKKQGSRVSDSIRKCLPHCAEAFSVWKRCCGERFLWDYLINEVATEDEMHVSRSVIKKVLLFQGKRRFFAKLTGPPRICYLNSIFPDAFFIHVIRDPRATVSSLLKVPFWKKGGGRENLWWQNSLAQDSVTKFLNNSGSPVALAAWQWKRVIDVAWQESIKIEASRYIEVRYEHFVNNPLTALYESFAKVNLPQSRNVDQYIRSLGNVKNMDFKFRQNLKSNEIDLVEKITFHTARKAGYTFY